ncbi:TIGR04100 family radical SAM protein [Inconstantimicrobium mannanitabidum]|uniref:Radical SAM protein n=1 Tax=Inconstantimicrobium mannanitabidum TaxID=1604901 RepID=A0ACB5RDB7_9CLOT|nr:TIGR04100 family radical SAM protein [Clostridium sp. TW13]GKX66754.1 radical SAM protein [Clostridium sp. TW13]
MKSMTILYTIGDSLYVNLTNRCPCNCTFCVRHEKDSVCEGENLWLEREPSAEEVIEEFKKRNLEDYKEVVFCGYGEPLVRIDELIEVSKYIRSVSDIKIRVNSNGLADLVHGKNTAEMLKGWVDSISISLNAPSKEEYNEITKSQFGLKAFDGLLNFAKEAKKNIEDVQFSVVDCITEDQIERSRKISEELQIPLRVRKMIE